MPMNIQYATHHIENLSVDDYRAYKMQILKKDFCIKLSQDQKDHFMSLKTDREIERYFFSILNQRFN